MDLNWLVKVDDLEHSTVTVFLTAREHVSYFSSLKHIETKRDFYGTLIFSLEAVLAALVDPLNRKRVDDLLNFLEDSRGRPKASKARPQGSFDVVAATKAKRFFPAECGLLRVGNELTFDVLAQLKRAAIMTYHPDRGGDHETMIKVEPAYLLIHDLLCRHTAEDEGTSRLGFEPISVSRSRGRPTATDYQLAFHELLFKVLVDDWDLASAHRIGSQLLDLHKAKRAAREKCDASRLIHLYCDLAERTCLTGRHTDAEQVLQFAKEVMAWSTKDRHHSRLVSMAEEAVTGKRAVKAIFNHERQVRNAYNNAAISEKRLKDALGRFDNRLLEEEQRATQLSQYVKTHGFLQNLPNDPSPQKAPELSGQLVPDPDYFEIDIRFMTQAQQLEYQLAFSEGTTLALVRKYTHVRLVSVMRSIIVFDDAISLTDAKRECYLLEDCQRSRGGWGKKVAQLIEYLEGLPQDERRERLSLLKRLDANAHEQFAALSLEGVSHRIGLSPQYLETARLSINSLKRSVSTGKVSSVDAHLYGDVDHRIELFPSVLAPAKIPEDTFRLNVRTGKLTFVVDEVELEQVKAAKIWRQDLATIKNLEKSDMIGILIKLEGQPAKIVEQLIPYCELLFEVGTQITHVEEIQLGYWIDRLTVDLVRLKRWVEAKDWLERYFSLPDRYRRRSTPSKDELMIKRLERCRRMTISK